MRNIERQKTALSRIIRAKREIRKLRNSDTYCSQIAGVIRHFEAVIQTESKHLGDI